MSVLVRKANADDAQFISLLARVTFTETFSSYFRDRNDLTKYLDDFFSVRKFRSSLEKENNAFWIAFYDELPVGYCKMKKVCKSEYSTSNRASQLQKIYVLQDFLSKQIGRQLSDLMFQEAKLIGTEQLWLSVLVSNDRAIRFYEKQGFVSVGGVKFSIGKEDFDFYVMQKDMTIN